MPVDPEKLCPDEPVITDSLFCERCGYSLKMLPLIGRCPECGRRYRARGVQAEGVFEPHTAEFPAFEMAGGFGSALLFCWLAYGAVVEPDLWGILAALTFGFLAVVFSRQAWRGVGRFIRAQKFAREHQED